MSVLCKCKTSSYEEVLRTVLTGAGEVGVTMGNKIPEYQEKQGLKMGLLAKIYDDEVIVDEFRKNNFEEL